ncbi:MAG: hypothetical protein JW798_06825 [Prolixibacteraceae bacterium]|nr:hypothetical protein [Prolixibacteraceae bacterium]
MRKKQISLFSYFILLLFTSCISSYHAIQPSFSQYSESENKETGGLVITPGNEDILTSNKVFQRKALKKGIKLIAVKIENHSSEPVKLDYENFEVFNDFELVKLLTPNQVCSKIGYNMIGRSAIFALCVAGSFQIGMVTTGLINLYSPFLYSSPFSLYYLIRSAVSNEQFKTDLESFGFGNRLIEPGETIYGIFAFKADKVGELLIRLKQ